MNDLTPFLGQHALQIWGAGILWSLIGIALVKVYYYDREIKFNLKFYLNDNLKDILLGVIASLIIMRLGDYAVQLARDKFGVNLPDTQDVVAFMIVISAIIQIKLHKERKPISKKVEAKMLETNDKNN